MNETLKVLCQKSIKISFAFWINRINLEYWNHVQLILMLKLKYSKIQA